MPAWSIPPLFYEQWLCIGTCLLLLALTLFGPRLQRNVAPKPHPFFIRHMKAFRWGRDMFAVCFVVAMLGVCGLVFRSRFRASLSGPRMTS